MTTPGIPSPTTTQSPSITPKEVMGEPVVINLGGLPVAVNTTENQPTTIILGGDPVIIKTARSDSCYKAGGCTSM